MNHYVVATVCLCPGFCTFFVRGGPDPLAASPHPSSGTLMKTLVKGVAKKNSQLHKSQIFYLLEDISETRV